MVAGFFLTEIIPSISKNLVTTTTLHKIWESTKRKPRRFLNQNSKETKIERGGGGDLICKESKIWPND
jgi:hypothetical protein